ncbi:MAG: CBS domain-containing protein [Bacteroidales bacterium]|nr:CBS domain-containing protein [Bacteroidales bacterium]MBQ5551290.1 CBS domain-containing protein [Bacteroidales bacterium]
MDACIMLDFIILPFGGRLVWLPITVGLLSLAGVGVMSLLADTSVGRVRASLNAATAFCALLVVMCAASLVRCTSADYDGGFAVVDFGDSPVTGFVLFFITIAFLLVITAMVPARLMDDERKEKLHSKYSWLVKTVCALTGWMSFGKAYTSSMDDDAGEHLSVAIGASPEQNVGNGAMIRNILQFGDIEVREIMTPRHEIVAIGRDEPFSVLKAKILDSNYSRIPVFESSTDNIYGIIYVKDLIKHLSKGDDFAWTTLVKGIKYVPENKKISDLLKEFQQNKNHMAAVSDEYGGISGLITMQDILEQIVGEISDEFDTDDDQLFRKVNDNYYIFDGRITIDDFCRELGLENEDFDDEKGDAESLAGLLLELRGEFPAKGEKIEFHSLTFSVESFTGRRIEKIGVRIS